MERRIEANSIVKCTLCNNCSVLLQLSESSRLFLEARMADGNVNEALDISRIAWVEFPRLKESAEAKRTAEYLLEGLQDKINIQVIMPISNTTSALTTIIERLEDLVENKNPTLIDQGFRRTLDGLKVEMNNIQAAIQEPNARITELSQMVNQLVYKPIAKGNAGETVLTEAWTEFFNKDEVIRVGGAGREDIVVTPFLTNGADKFGERIAIERKAGKQKFTGAHRREAIRHAKEAGAPFAMIIYDTQDSLPSSLRPVSLDRQDGVVTIVADMQSSTWKIARETIGVIQQAMYASTRAIEEINIPAIEEVITELTNVVKIVDQIKGSNAKIRNYTDEVEQSTLIIRTLIKNYQNKLQLAMTAAPSGEKPGIATKVDIETDE